MRETKMSKPFLLPVGSFTYIFGGEKKNVKYRLNENCHMAHDNNT